MEDLREWLPDFKIAIEFRQASWLKEERRERVLEFLKGHGLSYVVVDEPQGFGSSVPPVVAVAAPPRMVRFYRHNPEKWGKKGVSTPEKIPHLYQPSELKNWVPRLPDLAAQARGGAPGLNNCH